MADEIVIPIEVRGDKAVLDVKRLGRELRGLDGDAERATGGIGRMGTALKAVAAAAFFGVIARGLRSITDAAYEVGTATEETASKFQTVFGRGARALDERLASLATNAANSASTSWRPAPNRSRARR